MTGAKNLFGRAGVLAAAEAVNLAAGVATVIAVARWLDAPSLGLYSFSFAVGAALAVLAVYGSQTLIVRETARAPGELSTLLRNTLIARGALALLAAGGLAAVLAGLPMAPERRWTIFGLVASRLAEAFVLVICAFLRGLQDVRAEARIRLGLNLAHVTVALPVLFLAKSLPLFAAVHAGVSVLAFLEAVRFLIRRTQASPFRRVPGPWTPGFFRNHLRFSLHTILLVIYVQANTLLLFFLKGDEAVGVYTAAFRFVSALGMLAVGLTGAFFPMIARLSSADQVGEWRAASRRALQGVAVLGGLSGAALFVFAPRLISLFYGTAFQPAVVCLRIMSFAVLWTFLNSATGVLLFSLDRERALIRILGGAVGFVILVNLALLPWLGAVGASLTTALPEVLVFVWQSRALRAVQSQARLEVFLGKGLALGLVPVGASLLYRGGQAGTEFLVFGISAVVALYALGLHRLEPRLLGKPAFVIPEPAAASAAAGGRPRGRGLP
jgi:O-antigen/teichoic acid export membrane protein